MLTEKQKGVLRAMAIGGITSVFVLTAAVVMYPSAFIANSGQAGALVHTLSWDLLVVSCLMVSIGLLARHRFFSPDDIDGGGISKGTQQAHILQAVLQNTLEQTVLAVSVHMIWAVVMPDRWQAAVPAAAILFLIGRVLFARGYSGGAPARALGFALTFYPSVAMVVVLIGSLGLKHF